VSAVLELEAVGEAPEASRATIGGYLLLILGLSLFGSAIPDARPKVMGLLLHPYVFVLLLVAPVALFLPRTRARRGLGGAGIALMVGIVVSFVGNAELESSVHHFAKWGAVGLTFWATLFLVRTVADVRLALVGLIGSVAAIGVRGLFLHTEDPRYYVDVMPQIGSRNVYSMWTLAPLAYAFWISISSRFRLHGRALALAAQAAIIVPQVLSLSRSAWVNIIATVGLILGMRRSLAAVVFVVMMAFALSVVADGLGFGEKISDPFETEKASDQDRTDLVLAGIVVFLENPVFGVSLDRLPVELGKAIGELPIDSHNFAIEMLAGTGLVGTIPLLVCVLLMAARWRRAAALGAGPAADYVGIMPVLITLAALRGMTSNEIIYNPAVVMGFAIAVAAANIAIADASSPADAPVSESA
jgi:O-antigen ligase